MLASTICEPQPVLGINVKKEMEFKDSKFIDCLNIKKTDAKVNERGFTISFSGSSCKPARWSGLLLGRNDNNARGNFGVKMLPRIATVNALRACSAQRPFTIINTHFALTHSNKNARWAYTLRSSGNVYAPRVLLSAQACRCGAAAARGGASFRRADAAQVCSHVRFFVVDGPFESSVAPLLGPAR
jgi:hypothetical protein